jgi:uncharacterized protein (DUF2141 family)
MEALESRALMSAASVVAMGGMKFVGIADEDTGWRVLVPKNPVIVAPALKASNLIKSPNTNFAAATFLDTTTGSSSGTFNGLASASSQFTITVNLTGSGLTDPIRAAFTSAANEWMKIITAAPGVTTLTIDASIAPIDGVGKILGQAGPTQLSGGTYIPTRGVMQFDSADLTNMANNGSLADVIFHEMGHVLGFGTIWSYKKVTSGPSSDPRYTGTGTVGAHWRESIFSNEIMTGYINAGLNPVSTITIASMADLGYTVDMTAADAYVIPGVTPLGSGLISGTVFNDTDQDGSMDNGETGAAGRTVYLDANGNGVFDAGERSVTTGSDGSYSFNNLPAATYIVRLAIPANSTVIQTSPIATVILGNAQTSLGNNIGMIDAAGSVAGVVYADANNNGSRDQGESALSGYTVYLDSNNNGALDNGERTATTGNDGSYAFTGLAPGTYNVRVQMPATYVQTSGTSVTVGTAANVKKDVGLFDTAGTITGTVYLDANRNGKRDNGEAGQQGKVVYLDTNNNGVFDSTERSTTTNANGFYTFTGVKAGSYRVRVLLTGNNTVQTGDVSASVTAGNTTANVDIGWYDTNSVVSGTLFADTDNDGVRDNGETVLDGYTVYLDTNNNGKFDAGERSTQTASDGTFAFKNLPAGTYKVRAVLPNLWVINSGNTVTISAGQSATLSVPVFDSSTAISGTVYNDTNGDGSKANTEGGMSAVSVFLDSNNNGILDAGEVSTTTDRSGNYRFSNLPAGRYTVRAVPPAGMLQTQPTAGAANVITTVAGTTSSGTNFGVVINSGSVEGSVFLDANGDGVRNGTETGTSGVRVYVDLNNDGIFTANEPNAVSDATGKYSIRNVPQGTYKVKLALPGGLTQTTPSVGSPYTVQVTAGSVASGKVFGVAISRSAPAVRTVVKSVKALLAEETADTLVVAGQLTLPLKGLVPAFSDRLVVG